MLFIRLKNDVECPGISVVQEKDGGRTVRVVEDIFDPTVVLPDVPSYAIERVTYRDCIYRGFCREGIYRHRGAEMLMRADVSHSLGVYNDNVECQHVGISAPSIAVLKEIYTLARQGKLDPDENWEPDNPTNDSAAG